MKHGILLVNTSAQDVDYLYEIWFNGKYIGSEATFAEALWLWGQYESK